MNKKLTIEDFEVIPDPTCQTTCHLCFFNGDMKGCNVDVDEVGKELEEKFGACCETPEHYYKLKNKE